MSASFQEILADLRADFPGRQVLFAEDIAKVLGKTKAAVDRMRDRGTLQVHWSAIGGRLAVNIRDFAAFLAGPQSVAAPPAQQRRTAASREPQRQGQGGQRGRAARPSLFSELSVADVYELARTAYTIAPATDNERFWNEVRECSSALHTEYQLQTGQARIQNYPDWSPP